MEELKPCPFCGGDDVQKVAFGAIYTKTGEPAFWSINHQCKAKSGVVVEMTTRSNDLESAVRQWNQRAGD